MDELGNNTPKEAEEIALAALNEKYQTAFAVDARGGLYGTHDDSTIKLVCHAEDGRFKSVPFDVEVGKNDTTVTDGYLNLYAGEKISDRVSELCDGALVLTEIETPDGFSDFTSLDFEADEYLASLPVYYLNTYVFIKDNGAAAADKAKALYALGKSLEAFRYSDQTVMVFYCGSIDTDAVREAFYQNEYKYDYFNECAFTRQFTNFQLTDGALVTTEEEIANCLGE